MDHTYSLLSNKLFESINYLKDTTTLDMMYKVDVTETLKNIEKYLDELVAEIRSEPKDLTKIGQRSILVRLRSDKETDNLMPQQNVSQSDDLKSVTNLVHKVERLQRRQVLFFNKISKKIAVYQKELSDSRITVVIRKMPIELQVEPRHFDCGNRSPNEKVNPETNKRKHEDSDSEMERLTKRKSSEFQEFPKPLENFPDILVIGPNGTQIYRKEYEAMYWKDAASATRELCKIIFGERVLATHSLTGNQSPAFRGRERPTKAQLDPGKTGDITYLVCSKFEVTQQLVRSTITTKCADCTKKIKRLAVKNIN